MQAQVRERLVIMPLGRLGEGRVECGCYEIFDRAAVHVMKVLAWSNIAVRRMVMTREQLVVRFLVHKYTHPKFPFG